MDVAIQSVVGVAMVPEAILEKLEPMGSAPKQTVQLLQEQP